MNIGFIGSRSFNDKRSATKIINKLISKYKTFTCVSGGAKGADSICESICRLKNIECLIFKPEWSKYGKSAGFIRNKSIVENSDFVIAFWDLKSKGTKHSIDLCMQLNKPIFIINEYSNSA